MGRLTWEDVEKWGHVMTKAEIEECFNQPIHEILSREDVYFCEDLEGLEDFFIKELAEKYHLDIDVLHIRQQIKHYLDIPAIMEDFTYNGYYVYYISDAKGVCLLVLKS